MRAYSSCFHDPACSPVVWMAEALASTGLSSGMSCPTCRNTAYYGEDRIYAPMPAFDPRLKQVSFLASELHKPLKPAARRQGRQLHGENRRHRHRGLGEEPRQGAQRAGEPGRGLRPGSLRGPPPMPRSSGSRPTPASTSSWRRRGRTASQSAPRPRRTLRWRARR